MWKYRENGKTADVVLSAPDIKTGDGGTVASSLAEKMDKKIIDNTTAKKYELGINNALLYYREVF